MTRARSSVVPFAVFRWAGLLACGALMWSPAVAETWSDHTGKFQIEATFVGVEGADIVLKKPDGSTIKVPINRLSPASREQGKRLYKEAMAGADAATPAAPATASAPAAASAPDLSGAPSSSLGSAVPASLDRDLNFTPPTPSPVPPMATFPEGASLQETVDFVKSQFLAGHPEVVWHALPSEMREAFDSQAFRSEMVPLLENQAQTNKAMEGVLLKLVEVLVKKKEFVLGSSLMGKVPPPVVPMITQAYDPAVGAVFEISMMSFDTPALESMTVTQMLDYRGPRIGGHIKNLVSMLPPGMADQVISTMTVAQTGDSSGTITVPKQNGETETTEMVNYQGRWIPKDFADTWAEKKDNLIPEMKKQLQDAQAGEAAKQAQMAAGMITTMANGILDPMLAATTQEEFDQSLQQIMAMAQMFGGGGGPGGPGGFPGGPGPAGPGGFPGEPGGF